MNDGTIALQEYYAALYRLKAGKPQIVPKGTRITKDAVSVEAGRGRGTIKKSRPVFKELIGDIEKAALYQSEPKEQEKQKLVRTSGLAETYRIQWEAALARELSLLKELYEVRIQLSKLTGENVLPIRRR